MKSLLIIAGCLFALQVTVAEELAVAIDRGLSKVDVKHNGKPVTIMRNQDPDNTVDPRYAKTSRKCPPFCIQPIVVAEGVQTIGELELIDYISRAVTDDSILVIDSRTPGWVSKGTIPGSVNIPWTELNAAAGADPLQIAAVLEERFGALSLEGLWDFTHAKTLVLFCNGMW
ncbi:MAG: rhodanese-like domain-containing protein, partial [Gammaproteobacteria bacterium]|nr:rhodanese-like domain-containing protein [Gammaproteobacteria bacterium]